MEKIITQKDEKCEACHNILLEGSYCFVYDGDIICEDCAEHITNGNKFFGLPND